ncbi:MAG: hypothetical protein QW128_00700 [Thermoprotei archaeon]
MRGISEIISSMMILGLAVVLGIIIYTYALSVFTTTTSSFGSIASGEISRLKERFIIDNAWVMKNGTVILSVYNYGDVGVNIVHVYVNETLVTSSKPSLPLYLSPGGKAFIRFVLPVYGNVYMFSVESENGNSVVVVSKGG